MRESSKVLAILLALVLPAFGADRRALSISQRQADEGVLGRRVSGLDATPRQIWESFHLLLDSAGLPSGAVLLPRCKSDEWPVTFPVRDGTKVRQALDALVRANPAYRWE